MNKEKRIEKIMEEKKIGYIEARDIADEEELMELIDSVKEEKKNAS